MRLFLFLLSVSLFLSSCDESKTGAQPDPVKTTIDAKQMVADGAQLIDVRTPAEFESGHIAGAKNLPLDELPRRLDELGDKSGAIVLYCRSGARSGAALRTLHSSGFTNAHNLGPMSAW